MPEAGVRSTGRKHIFMQRRAHQGVRRMRCRSAVQNGATVRKTHKRECNIERTHSSAKAVSEIGINFSRGHVVYPIGLSAEHLKMLLGGMGFL